MRRRNYWLKLSFVGMIAFILIFAGSIAWFSYQRAQAYLHPPRNYPTGELLRQHEIPYQFVQLTTEDGLKLAAWYTPPQNGALILVAHGYGDKRQEDFYDLFAQHGYGVLAWDFRAHGNSEGGFSSLGYYEVMDVKAALDYALAQPGVKHVGGWGGSMGAVTMIRAAAKYPQIEAIVTDSAFATLEEEMDLQVPFPILRPLIRFFAEQQTGVSVDEVRPVDDVAKISPRPIYVIQGSGDTMIPVDSAQRIYDAAGEPKFVWTEPDVPHLNMYAFYRERYTKRVIKFFDQYLLNK
jgi:uncharacterized protein